MAYGNFKELTIRTDFDKTLHDKAFNIAKNPKYDGCQCGLASMVYKSFDKKTSGSGIQNKNISNQYLFDLACVAKVSDHMQELAEELHKSVIRIFKKRKVPFVDNI